MKAKVGWISHEIMVRSKKSALDNISVADLKIFKQAAEVMLEMPDDKLALAIASGEIIELADEDDKDDDEHDDAEKSEER